MRAIKSIAMGSLLVVALGSVVQGAPMRRGNFWRNSNWATPRWGFENSTPTAPYWGFPDTAESPEPLPVYEVLPAPSLDITPLTVSPTPPPVAVTPSPVSLPPAPVPASITPTPTAPPALPPGAFNATATAFAPVVATVPNPIITPVSPPVASIVAPATNPPLNVTSSVIQSGPGINSFDRPAPVYDYDAYLNLGDGPYASAAILTTGGAQPWYLSPVVQKHLGDTPTLEQRADFSETVLARVEDSFANSGIPVKLTTDPNASAAHTMSLVSQAQYGVDPNAVGIATLGGDGFSFIDKFDLAGSTDELAWAVARNMAHELMHVFDVEHHDVTGNYLDAGTTNWQTLVAPDATFSPGAVAALLNSDFQKRYDGMGRLGAQAQTLEANAVPEPATLLLWTILGGIICGGHRHYRRRRTAA